MKTSFRTYGLYHKVSFLRFKASLLCCFHGVLAKVYTAIPLFIYTLGTEAGKNGVLLRES